MPFANWQSLQIMVYFILVVCALLQYTNLKKQGVSASRESSRTTEFFPFPRSFFYAGFSVDLCSRFGMRQFAPVHYFLLQSPLL